MDDQRKKWRAVLESVVDVTLFLNKQNLPFRGHHESSESKNHGYVVETVKLLASVPFKVRHCATAQYHHTICAVLSHSCALPTF